ncbi:hypothetical protein QQF64_026123 [Cirrhinus molitorella]|uniref:G-protein coupled receptors family 1 profile domain-containing protein n=1 Tax=Cirrhinus molitorella TaxID=172907 RepID=A0ABR3NQZ5_9TELE
MVTHFMPSIYIIIILISLPLNSLALVTFTCTIREKKPAVIYMSHLACVDLLFTLLLPMKIHYQLNASDWVFGEAACRVLSAAYYCYMYCSILLMMSMSVDRLLEDVGVTCHDVLHHIQLYAYLFFILSCLYFFLPLVVTLVSYSVIIYVLTTKNDHLKTTYSDKRRRAVIMTVAVLMEFVVCFAPTNVILFVPLVFV